MGGQAERAQPVLRCNGCWADVDCKEHSVVANCGHMYCLTCCQTIMDSDDSTCPICTQLIQKNNVKAVHALSSARDLALVLCGQSPAVILEVAHVAIEFYNGQQGLYAEYAQAQSSRKIAKTQDQCRKKLQEVHNGYLAAKRKYQEVLAQKHALQEDNKELQDKYNQKAMADKKMKENFHLLQQENEQLRRQLGLHKGGGGGGGGGMQLGMPAPFGVGGAAGGGGRASRMGVLGMDDGMMRAPATVLAPRAIQPDPSPLASMLVGPPAGGFGGGGRGVYGYETPENHQVIRQLQTSGGSGSGARMLGGMSGGGMRRSGGLNNDKRNAMGFNAPPNSMATM